MRIMRAGGVVVCRGPCASALRAFRIKPSIRCLSSSSTAVTTTTTTFEHGSFIRDIAAAKPPEHLNYLLNVLQASGETIASPGAREGLFPLVIPLSINPSGALTSFLRWPTAPPGMEMPIVEVHQHGVWLLAKNTDQYIHRMLVEEDANVAKGSINKLCDATSDAGKKLYTKGDFMESSITDLDVYILKKVGLFPDVIERKVARHFEKGDHVSAMVTGEFYTRGHFPGFGRPFVFNAEILLKVGRKLEAKDAARGALKSPWWTLGCKYHEVAEIAQWDDEQIEFIKEKVSKDGKLEDLKKGKAPEQVSLDEAAFLLDLASVEGTWTDNVDRIAECYREAGLSDIARFVLYKD
ncbi:protein IN CHLOROPLAST ATPASE BIOGENESIS, chloroplastic [Dioscorea cayenensis subsp. rotundata]|uniref:Protein IN CHLOROPLAST ATPASE BIOGENESIS, chloroplastic n=1 Tax=Dioscorea cayennensis subsp. rotundata TaxID=55577 RepID=A0AB40BK98_DIOCR|nr:protein IN CHLOROPLAST ATPASE BIOGENESIS, chloroplastic [Dioscorea cayenensis subsp. rotundata]